MAPEKKNKLPLAERLRKRREDITKNSKGNYSFFLIPEGTLRVRAVDVGEDNEPGMEVQHVFLNKELGGFILPSSFGLPCAITEAYQTLSKSKNDDERELAKKLKPKNKTAMLVYRFTDEKGKEVDTASGVKPVLMSTGLYGEILDLWLDEDEAGIFTDNKTGYDLKLKRTGKGQLDTEYSVIKCKNTPTAKEFKGVFDLEEALKKIVPTYEETDQAITAFLGLSSEDEPKKKSSKEVPLKKKKKNRDI